MRRNRLFFSVFLIACVISIGSIYKVFVEKTEYRLFYKGDSNSEFDAYTAGLNFSRHGFSQLYFLPALRYEEALDAVMKQRLYTHYPPGPYLVSGALQKFGIQGFYEQKAWILVVNIASMLILTCAIRRMLPAERAWAPFILLSLALTSVWFVWWAGNLHQHAYTDLLMTFGLWTIVTQRARLFLLACFVAMFFSFEPVPWLFVLGVFFTNQNLMAKTWSRKQAAAFIVTMIGLFFLTFGIHLLQNACYFHSFSATINDLRSSLQVWSGVTDSVSLTAYSITKHLVKFAYTSLWFYGTGVLILAGFGLTRSVRQGLWLPIVLLCAGLPWQVLLHQHSMVHGFMARHFGIGLFVLATIGFFGLWEQVLWKRLLAVLLLVAAVVRLPAGCEISNNRFCLDQFHKVIAQTDSGTIAKLLCFFKDNPEHIQGKRILINELALRHQALPDQPAYTLMIQGNPVTLVRVEPGWTLSGLNLPKDKIPVFCDQASAYLDVNEAMTSQSHKPTNFLAASASGETLLKTKAPIALSIDGNCDELRYRFLLAWLLLV